MRNFKQMTAIGLSVLSIAQCFSPVFAEGEVTNTISEAGSLSSDVTYSQDSSFTVSIPKTIALNSNKEASYTISVTGDVCGDESVTVTPDSSITLQDANGKSPVVATVTQEKTKFTASDINGTEAANKQTTGKITASGLTAGNWSGTLSFAIDKKGLEPGLYDDNGTLLCSWEESGIDIEKDQEECESGEPDSAYYVLTHTYKTATKVVIPDGITRIGGEAFCHSDLKSIIIPSSVTSIGSYAFDNCISLTSVTIPNSVTSIGNYAFNYCSSLTSVTVDENNPNYCSVGGVLFNKDKSTLIKYPSEKKDTSYTIPSSITSIGDYAFFNCKSLTSITIPNSVTSIGLGAFRSCRSLTSVTIPNSVTSIENYAFHGCDSLTSVTIPNSVTSIGGQTFYGCDSLTSVTIPNSVTSIGSAFNSCSSLTSVTYKGTTYTSKSALINALKANNVTVSSSAFYNTVLTN